MVLSNQLVPLGQVQIATTIIRYANFSPLFGHVNLNQYQFMSSPISFPFAGPDFVPDVIIVTPDMPHGDPVSNPHPVAAVGMLQPLLNPVTQVHSFGLTACNSDCTAGKINFVCMGIQFNPTVPGNPNPNAIIPQPIPDIRIGIARFKEVDLNTQGNPQSTDGFFAKDCSPGDTLDFQGFFHPPLPFSGDRDSNTSPLVLLTTTNLLIHHLNDFSPNGPEYDYTYNVPAVGIVKTIDHDATSWTGFDMQARNFDATGGTCNFNYVAFALNPKTGQPEKASGLSPINQLWVDGGVTSAKGMAPGGSNPGTAGDWQEWQISFKEPFLTPPIVLVTGSFIGTVDFDGNEVFSNQKNPTPQGIARDVSPYGFTLAARNCTPNSFPLEPHQDPFVQFHWVAFGIPLTATTRIVPEMPGVATLGQGKTSVQVGPNPAVTRNSVILCTVFDNGGVALGPVWAEIDQSGIFTIFASKAPTTDTLINYRILN